MLSDVPLLGQLGLYRFSSEKKETFLKLVILSLAAILCMFIVACLVYVNYFHFLAFSTRLFAVLRFESVIHEFDP